MLSSETAITAFSAVTVLTGVTLSGLSLSMTERFQEDYKPDENKSACNGSLVGNFAQGTRGLAYSHVLLVLILITMIFVKSLDGNKSADKRFKMALVLALIVSVVLAALDVHLLDYYGDLSQVEVKDGNLRGPYGLAVVSVASISLVATVGVAAWMTQRFLANGGGSSKSSGKKRRSSGKARAHDFAYYL